VQKKKKDGVQQKKKDDVQHRRSFSRIVGRASPRIEHFFVSWANFLLVL
jgi:hypothetical protein